MAGENITVSRETLRAELSGLELRLVDRLTEALKEKADSAQLQAVEARVDSLELTRAGREHMAEDMTTMNTRVTRLERFRYAVPSVSVLGLIVTVIALALTGHHTP